MPKLELQVLFKTLKNPVCIAIFNADGFCKNCRLATADKLREDLNRAGIKFAAVNREPPIQIFVEKEDVDKLKELNIKILNVFN